MEEQDKAADQKQTGSLDELYAMLRDFDTAMLVTFGRDRQLRARPMALQDPAEVKDADLWFVTLDDTPKTDDIRDEHQVNVCCFRARDKAYLSISARAHIDANPAEVKRLWNPDWKVWFPDEPEDAAMALLKLEIEHAEYWAPEGGRVRTVFAAPAARKESEAATEPGR